MADTRYQTRRPAGRRPNQQGASPVGERSTSDGQRPSKQTYTRAYKRNRGRSRSASIVAGIFIFAALIYIAQSVYFFFSKPHIATEVVEMGSVALPQTIRGIIIRDEVVYTSDRDGQLEFAVNEYDRVKAGTEVCQVIENTEALAEINAEIESLDDEIMALQSMRTDVSGVDPAVRRANENLTNIIESNIHSFTSRDISKVYALKDNITKIVDTRSQMIRAENIGVKTDLGTQHQQLQSRLAQLTKTITANESGLMARVVDGVEGTYTLENMKDLTREQAAQTVDYNDIVMTTDVKASAPVFKIVASNNWYIGAYIPNELIEGYAVDDRRLVYMEDPEQEGEYLEFIMVVEYISPTHNDSYVLFRCNKNIIEYLNTRNVNIRTSDSVRTGFKISNTAITSRRYIQIPAGYVTKTEGHSSYVLTSVNGALTRVPVIIMDEDESFVYVSENTDGLAAGVTLTGEMATGETLPDYVIPEVAELPGVYRVNNGITQFTRITLDGGKPDEGEYTLLEPALNHGLKAYDYIVVNAADVSEGKIIN